MDTRIVGLCVSSLREECNVFPCTKDSYILEGKTYLVHCMEVQKCSGRCIEKQNIQRGGLCLIASYCLSKGYKSTHHCPTWMMQPFSFACKEYDVKTLPVEGTGGSLQGKGVSFSVSGVLSLFLVSRSLPSVF